MIKSLLEWMMLYLDARIASSVGWEQEKGKKVDAKISNRVEFLREKMENWESRGKYWCKNWWQCAHIPTYVFCTSENVIFQLKMKCAIHLHTCISKIDWFNEFPLNRIIRRVSSSELTRISKTWAVHAVEKVSSLCSNM